MTIWDEFEIGNGKTVRIEIGSLCIWIEHRHEEYLFAVSHDEAPMNTLASRKIEAPETIPPPLDWNRYVIRDDNAKFQILPILPDRAVVVNPEFPVKLAPDSNVLFFMSIPMWIQLMAGSKKKVTFLEIPSQILSNTWFGDTMTGELCYALKTRALKKLEEHTVLPQRIVCPVRIMNRGQVPLDFQSLCVHVEHLRVYRGSNHLWTNEVNITYKGDEQPSEIRYVDRIPKFEEPSMLISREREPSQKKIISKSFSIIKTITTFD